MTPLQLSIVLWARERELNDPVKQTLKTLAEAGELADAVCKSDLPNKQDNLAEIIDAIGDIEVCLTILKNQLGLTQDFPLQSAYDVISKRTGKTINGTFIKD